jgi:prepilin-type N-terminal cleavage/methylation domain-containing protein
MRKRAFTLIELLLAMTILGLIMASVMNTMQVGVDAFAEGKASLELYQNGRIALRKLSEDLRFSLPFDAFWRPSDRIQMMSLEQLAQMRGMAPGFNGDPMLAGLVQEEDPGAIRFMGESDSVLFVRKVYQLGQNPPFDLQECRVYVDSDRHHLVLEIVRSLLAVKQASWFYQFLFQVDVGGIVLPQGQSGRVRYREYQPDVPMLQDFIQDYGMIGKRLLLAEGVTEIKFRYSDGKGWKSNWDSQVIMQRNRISQNSPNFNMVTDIHQQETGPPAIVEISLTLENGDTLATATDIPSGDRMRSNYGMFAQQASKIRQQNQPRNETPGAVPGQ